MIQENGFDGFESNDIKCCDIRLDQVQQTTVGAMLPHGARGIVLK
jgi:hypothetical protein